MPTGLAVCFKRGLWITRLIQIRSFMMFFALIIMLFDTCFRFLEETITFQFICIICVMPLVLCTEGIKRSIFLSSFQLWEFLVLRNVLVLLRHLYEILPLVRCHHNGNCISIQICRWTYKRCASSTRFPTVDSRSQNIARHLSHCGFLQTSLLGSNRNWEYHSRDKLE